MKGVPSQTGRRRAGTKAGSSQDGMTAARREADGRKERGEEGQVRKTARRIIKITARMPIILKAIEAAAASIRIARKNLKGN